jgi:hypothetical protein
MGVNGQRHDTSALYPRGRDPGTHCTGGWVGPRAGLDTEDRGKFLCPCRGSNPDRLVVQPVARHYTAWHNPAQSRWGRNLKFCRLKRRSRDPEIVSRVLTSCLRDTFLCLSVKANPLLDKVETWNSADKEGPTEPKGNICNSENVTVEGPKSPICGCFYVCAETLTHF